MVHLEKTPQVWLVEGNLGGGKTLTSVAMAVEAIRQGYFVATNIVINIPLLKQTIPYADKLYYHFTVRDEKYNDDGDLIYSKDFNPFIIPSGSPRGTKNPKRVLVILDECAEWFDQYQTQKNKSISRVMSWLRHSSKRNQDVVFIVQRIEYLQKSFRILCSRIIQVHDLAVWRFPALRFRIPFCSGLVVANVFDKVGTRCQVAQFVSKKYYGRYYDTAQNLSTFGGHSAVYDLPQEPITFPKFLAFAYVISCIILLFV